jgi:hypothetical protein
MSRLILFVAGAASAVTASVGTFSVAGMGTHPISAKQIMVESDFGEIRRQALLSHPVGSRISDVAEAMEKLGFRCRYHPNLVENSTAPTILCDSNGHNGAGLSRLDVQIIARDGTLADIVVSNGLDNLEASAITPDPNPGGRTPELRVTRPAPDPEWDAILARAAGHRF